MNSKALQMFSLLAASLAAGTSVAQSADLTVRVGAFDGGSNPSLAVNGAPKAFGVTVTNLGPDVATNVRVTATPPFGGTVSVPSTSSCLKPGADAGASYTCSLASLAVNESAQFTWSVAVVGPDAPPATCPTDTGLGASVTATETDPVTTNNSNTLADIAPPLAFLSATAESPAPNVKDGGVPPKRVKPGETVALKGTITNDGPCAVPADSLTIDSSFDNTLSAGLEFVSGGGGCTDWSTSMPADTADGVCTVGTSLAPGASLDFTVNQKILPLSDAGGDSIIQTAAQWNYVVDYAGNPVEASPTAEIIVAGHTNSCAVAGGGLGLPLLLLLLARRRSRQ